MGVSPQKVSEWKSGKAKSYTKRIPQIAEALGTTTEYLLTGNGPKQKRAVSESDTALPKGAEHIDLGTFHRILVRRQDQVDNGEVAVVMVGDEDATVKRFYATGNTVTLMPQSTNLEHQPQIYDTTETKVRVIGKVVKVEFTL